MAPERQFQTKSEPDLPELGLAVRRIRQTAHWSQDQMARHTGIARPTLSRFELGKQEPRSHALLAKLRDVAKALNLIEEFKLFEQAAQRVQPSYVDLMENQMASLRSSKAKPRCTPTEWRLMQIARLAARCYPEQARAIEQAAGPLAAFVDDFLGEAARAGIEPDESSFDDLERRLVTMAEQRVFEKKGTK